MNILTDLFPQIDQTGLVEDEIDLDKIYDVDYTPLFCEARKPIYPGCNQMSVLTAVIQMMNMKSDGGLSVQNFNMWLKFIKTILPAGECLPESYYECRKMMRNLGMTVETIHACKNNCVLFRKENAHRNHCPTCGASRWQSSKGKSGKSAPTKVLRYFPLKPRLQRLFVCRSTALSMRWHANEYTDGREKDVLRHPSDSKAWKKQDELSPEFGSDPRNVRLGLASDGFNPFGMMSSTHSTWPVLLFPYNVAPWQCFKEPYVILSTLIPDPDSPGRDIDIYLQPLIDELNDLWSDGISV
jgi:hypothetical protein